LGLAACHPHWLGWLPLFYFLFILKQLFSYSFSYF
jgi:hypothetical protein